LDNNFLNDYIKKFPIIKDMTELNQVGDFVRYTYITKNGGFYLDYDIKVLNPIPSELFYNNEIFFTNWFNETNLNFITV